MLNGSHISLKGERKGIRKFNISYGASGGNRTPIRGLEGRYISRYTTPAYFRNVPDEPHWRQGLLLTAYDLVFGVINFRLYYTLLTELRYSVLERIEGIEPSTSPWQEIVLPLNHICILVLGAGFEPAMYLRPGF